LLIHYVLRIDDSRSRAAPHKGWRRAPLQFVGNHWPLACISKRSEEPQAAFRRFMPVA
jgi:hypothetical protein